MAVIQPTQSGQQVVQAGRKAGYVIAALVNGLILYVVNNFWDSLGFMTAEFEDVLPIVNVSLAATILVNVVYVGFDAPWFRSLTQLVISGIGIAVMVRTLTVFPFDFSGYSFDWAVLVRVLLVVGLVGTAIAIVVQTVTLLKRLARL